METVQALNTDQKFYKWRERALQLTLDELSPLGCPPSRSKASGPFTALLIALGALADASLISDIHTDPGSEPSTSPRITLKHL